jgi:hypothetical protein
LCGFEMCSMRPDRRWKGLRPQHWSDWDIAAVLCGVCSVLWERSTGFNWTPYDEAISWILSPNDDESALGNDILWLVLSGL